MNLDKLANRIGFFVLVVVLLSFSDHIYTSTNFFSSPQTKDSVNKPNGNFPNNISPACFCMDVLSGANMYNANAEQKVKCKRMYKCFENAQADCLLRSETIWYECVG